VKADEQGTRDPGRRRHMAVPRTLIFVTSRHPETGAGEVLLLKGAAQKRLWAGRYNGLGGHVEASEDILTSAQRELQEETGLTGISLALRGVVHIDTGQDEEGPRPGVLMFVLVGESDTRTVHATEEGMPEWLPIGGLDALPLVDDLYAVIPRALGDGPFFYGSYRPDGVGKMQYAFRNGP
jgi:8-oxo-dGTP diphosphatase